MKFLLMIQNQHRLMSAAEELDGGGDIGGTEGGSTDSGLSIAPNEETWDLEEPSDEDIFKNYGLDSNKYGKWEDDPAKTEEEKPQGSEEAQAPGPETDEKLLLEKINSLGMVHAENPLKVESIDEAKNLIQMGKDYTQKTQALSEERKAFETEKTATQDELNKAIEEFNTQYKGLETTLQEMQQFKFALEHLKSADPDVYEAVMQANKEIGDRFKNPFVDQQLEAMNKRLAETESQLSAERNKLVIDKFESEFSSLSATEQSLKELGITVNKDEVKKHWAKSGLSVKEAMGSLYFEQMTKAQASKAKVEAVRAKTAARPAGAASASRPGSREKSIDPKLKGLSLGLALWDKYKQ